jgi:hypothetical protein
VAAVAVCSVEGAPQAAVKKASNKGIIILIRRIVFSFIPDVCKTLRH